ncbi:MAG: hypothetical protein K5648_07630 [Erysipelotrichaceae bacterium]|nr:hypothetical protein [Erysipelotrichaceae bacterium]
MDEKRYSLVLTAGYTERYWRIRIFPQEKENIDNFMRHEVMGPYGSADWIFPGLKEKGIAVFINTDDYCLNLDPNFIAKDTEGKDVLINGNILFLHREGDAYSALNIEEINGILRDHQASVEEVHACLCYEEVKGKILPDKKLIEIVKDRV